VSRKPRPGEPGYGRLVRLLVWRVERDVDWATWRRRRAAEWRERATLAGGLAWVAAGALLFAALLVAAASALV
jgi:hypothetical protein